MEEIGGRWVDWDWAKCLLFKKIKPKAMYKKKGNKKETQLILGTMKTGHTHIIYGIFFNYIHSFLTTQRNHCDGRMQINNSKPMWNVINEVHSTYSFKRLMNGGILSHIVKQQSSEYIEEMQRGIWNQGTRWYTGIQMLKGATTAQRVWHLQRCYDAKEYLMDKRNECNIYKFGGLLLWFDMDCASKAHVSKKCHCSQR